MISAYVKDLKSWNWDIRGIGIQHEEALDAISLTYAIVKEAEIHDARQLLVNGVEKLLSDINRKEINSNLTTKTIKLSLAFTKPDHSFLEDDFIAYAALNNGSIIYATKHPDDPWLHPVYGETYEEALEIISQENALTHQ